MVSVRLEVPYKTRQCHIHGIEPQTTLNNFYLEAEIKRKFLVYNLSLLVNFSKKMSNIPVDNGSSLNMPITIKIIALTNIIVRVARLS
jgi:hypothetical protein